MSVAVFVVATSDGGEDGTVRNGGSVVTGDIPTRGCAERTESLRPPASTGPDTVIGPLRFPGLAAAFRDNAEAGGRNAWTPLPGVGTPAIKTMVILRAGKRVTLTVPKDQRKWLGLLYVRPYARGGAKAVSLRACRPSYGKVTQFSGGFAVDFANAPDRGQCAEIRVKVDRPPRVLQRRLFHPPAGSCDGDPR
jgi:hypothetical protein